MELVLAGERTLGRCLNSVQKIFVLYFVVIEKSTFLFLVFSMSKRSAKTFVHDCKINTCLELVQLTKTWGKHLLKEVRYRILYL